MSDVVEKIKALPQNIRSFAFSDALLVEVKKAFALFGIDSSKSESIAGEIGLVYVGDLRLGGLPKLIQQKIGVDERISVSIAYEINKRIFNKFPEYFKDSNALLEEWGRMKSAPIMSEDEAWQKVLEIEPWIAELDQEKKEESEAGQKKEEERRAAMVQIRLQEALKKFEKLGEQHLSANPIKLKIFDAPVRPSIKNWISDYYEKVDARKHDSIERGNYLFHSENARRLTTGERNRVGTMLRALDEDGMVMVDSQRQEIVFGNGIEAGEKREEGVNRVEMGLRGGKEMGVNENPAGGTSFSSGHKFPFEQQNINQSSAQQRQNLRPSNNIVNLKNDSLD